MVPQPEAVIRIASRSVERGPGVDIGARLRQRLVLAAHVMDQRAAAAGAVRQHHLDAVARQHADRRGVDLGRQHVVDAAGKERDAAVAPARGRECLRRERAVRRTPGRQAQHGGKPLEPDRLEQRRERLGEPRRMKREPEALRIGHQLGEQRAQQALAERAPVGLLDMGAGMIDEVHVVDAGRAGRHAGEARQAAIDMLGDLGRRRPVVLQHVLDEVDAPARRIELIAVEHIGRASRVAEAAMHAGAQDLFRFRDVRIGKLRQSEGGLHGYTPAHMRPALSTPCGSKLLRTRCGQCRKRRRLGREHGDRGAHGGRRANERGVAAGGRDG